MTLVALQIRLSSMIKTVERAIGPEAASTHYPT